MNIGKKLILVNISILLIGVLLFTAVFVKVTETQIRTLINREIYLVAQKEGKEIQLWLEVYLDIARTLSQIMERVEEIPIVRRRPLFNLLLNQIVSANPEIVGAWTIWEPNELDGLDAQFAGAVGASAEGRFAPWWLNIDGEIKLKTSVDYEREGQGDFYQLPFRTGKEAIIDPTYWMIEDQEKLLVDVAAPIKKDGAPVGAVGFDIEAPVIQARVMSIKPYEGSVSAVYSSRGVICGHFDPSRIGKEMSLTERSLAGDNLEALARAVRQGKTFSFFNYVPELKENMFFIVAPFFIGRTDTPWTLMVGIPAKIITDPVYRALVIGLGIGLALIVLIVAATILNAYSISKPLNQMMQSFKSIEDAEEHLFKKGRFIQNLPHAIIRQQNEIGKLAMAFAGMSESLQEVVSNIEYITASARGGNLLARAKTTSLRGNYLRILKGLNNAMDVICDQFDAVPDAIALFDSARVLVYRNHAMDEFIKRHGFDANDGQFLATILARAAATNWEEKEKGEVQVDALFSSLFTPDTGDAATYTVDIVLQEHMYAMTLKRSGNQRHLNPSVDSLCVMLLLTDITGIAKARLEAEAASKAKSDFLSRMSHEIRTPLNAVMGMTQVALKTDDAEKMQACLKQIDNSSAHLLGVINDILDFSKFEAGKLYLEPVEFSLIDDISFVVSMLQRHAKERRISIRLELGEIRKDCLFADSLRLNQALINLLSNAIKFSRPEGEVRLIVKQLADTGGHEEGTSAYYFEVIDEGIGISEKQAAKLFQPFEQADGGIARSYGGAGLGLVISKNIVEMMGGTIVLKSKQGEGSSFSFTIRCPACDKKIIKEAETDEVEAMPDFSGKRCLIVDDIDINREILRELFEDTGIAIEMASNGKEALACFEASQENYYDIILMDIQMPVMDGCAATEKIRSMRRQDAETLPIIAMTADVIQEDVIKMREAGMNEHVGKPIDMDKLFKTLREFLPA